jgi:hypothetical protein
VWLKILFFSPNGHGHIGRISEVRVEISKTADQWCLTEVLGAPSGQNVYPSMKNTLFERKLYSWALGGGHTPRPMGLGHNSQIWKCLKQTQIDNHKLITTVLGNKLPRYSFDCHLFQSLIYYLEKQTTVLVFVLPFFSKNVKTFNIDIF